jgi:thiosulfate dehydrogenase (quinone) large subunit
LAAAASGIYMWFEAGWHKSIDPKWMGTGEALLDFWKRGLKMTPKPAISFDWYRSFIEYLVNSEAHTWFSRLLFSASSPSLPV